MASFEFVTVDVFTDHRFGGNPLAVFPAAEGLETRQMQALAGEFNLSETCFLLPPTDPINTAELRIFTPKGELPFAGHPSIGAAYVLARQHQDIADSIALEQAAGLVTVHVSRGEDGQPSGALLAAPRSLSVGIELALEDALDCARLRDADLVTNSHGPLAAGVGIDFIFCELASVDALARATPNLAAFRDTARRYPEVADHFALYLYVRDANDPSRIEARCFAPLLGIPEDPATGSAAAALAALLTSLAPGEDVELAFNVFQGEVMGRPSRLLASAAKSAEGGIRASVAGGCVPVLRGVAEV